MTLAEFKAWFEGFTEDMDGPPNEKQFKKIKAKVKEITGTPITQHVIREYYDRYRPYWASYGINDLMIGAGALPKNGGMSMGGGGQSAMSAGIVSSALYDMGQAEYKAMLS